MSGIMKRNSQLEIRQVRLGLVGKLDHQNAEKSLKAVSETSAIRLPVFRGIKRAIDICLSIPIVVICLPVLCVVVKMAQLLQSSGPLFYRQVRCGRDSKPFSILKFRTMNVPVSGASDIGCDASQRIFPIGSLLRVTKIDEFPQFLNVLLGSMSIVGPRPHHFDDCHQFQKVVKDYPQRIVAKPGITGLAQYTEYCGVFKWNCVQSRVERDLVYIRDWSLLLDLKLIFNTARVVLMRIVSAIGRRTVFWHRIAVPELRVFKETVEVNLGASVSESERRAA